MTELAYLVAIGTSAVWFGLAFRYFTFQNQAAAKLLIAKSARHSPVFQSVIAAVRFLGGFNAAFALLCLILVILAITDSPLFLEPMERVALLVAIGTAHFSQFLGNVPVLKNGERQGEAYWPVMSGPMFWIFTIDAAEAVLCYGAALILLFGA